MKTRLKIVSALLFNAAMGVVTATLVGIPSFIGAAVAVFIAVMAGCFMPQGSLCAGVFTEIWTGELVKKLKAGLTATWLDGLPDYSAKAENDVIHLIDVGGDPDVLVNNTTYPIPIQDLKDGDIAISLDKYQTKATRVSDDELYACSYDKIASHKERHGDAILVTKFKKAAHALSPQKDTVMTPVIMTTGENDNGRRRITTKDIIRLKDRFDKMEVPTEGRRLVLCSDHVNDLLASDQKFKDQYYNYTTGKVANMYGFEVYEYVSCPLFNSKGEKKVFGEAAAQDDRQASFAFYTKRMFKAAGSTKMYYSEAKTNPLTQESLVNFRHHYIVLPKKQEAIGAIVSANFVPQIAVDETELAFPVEGETKQVSVNASSDFGFTTPEGFQVVKQGTILLVTAADNSNGTAAKAGEITLTLAEDATKTVSIKVSQPFPEKISVDPAELAFAAAGEAKQVTVSATSDYTYNEVEGFTVEKKDGSLTVTASDNSASDTPREGTLTLTLSSDKTKTASVKLSQPGKTSTQPNQPKK